MKKEKFFKNLIYGLIAVLYGWSLTFSISESMKLDTAATTILLYCFILILVLSIAFYNKITTMIAMFSFLWGMIYAGYRAIEKKLLITLYGDTWEFFRWLYHYIIGKDFIKQPFVHYLILGITAMVCLFAYFVIVKWFAYYLMVAGGILYCFITLLMGRKVCLMGFGVYLFCIACLYSRKAFRKSRIGSFKGTRQHSTGELTYVLWSIPFVVLALFMANFASGSSGHDEVKKASINQFATKWIENNVQYYRKSLQNQSWLQDITLPEGSNFSLALSGFYPNRSRMGGNITLDDSLVLNVKADYRTYLKGSIKDYYTGRGWTTANKERYIITDREIDHFITDSSFSDEDIFMDFLHRSGYKKVEPDTYNKVFVTGTAEVEDVGLNTNTLFYADNLVSLLEWNQQDNSIMTNDNAEYYFSNKQKGVKRYNFRYRFVNRLEPLAQELLKLSSPERIKPYIESKPGFLQKYNDIQERYRNLDNVPQRVIDLAKELTAGDKSRYEKVTTIEKYLSSNYQYTLSPGTTPKDRDFVDYFLFDLKKGYCTYYASAMAVMVRALGIPARYVEGFILPEKPDDTQVYRIRNDLAHAWVEVFFDGFGWVRFEPTAPFNDILLGNQNKLQENPLKNEIPEEKYNQYMDHIQGNMPEYTIPPSTVNPSEVQPSGEGEGKTDRPPHHKVPVLLWIVTAAILVIPGLIARRLLCVKKMKDACYMPANHTVIILYQRILFLMKFYHCSMRQGETPLEYAERVEEELPEQIGQGFFQITGLYLKGQYSHNELDEADKQEILSFYNTFVQSLKKQLKFIKYYYHKYILNRY